MFSKPNYTQVPNEFFDQMIPTLKEGELRVLLVIMRQTFGWGNKLWDRISLSQLSEKTGMERKSVCRSLKTLIEKKMVTKHKCGPQSKQECWFSLVVETPLESANSIDDSNNFTQCPKDTPPSVLKTPTKETLPKEKEEESTLRVPKKGASPPAAPPPTPSGHYSGQFEGRIKIPEEAFERLIAKFGREMVDDYANRLYVWSFNNEKAFSKKKFHDRVIESWMLRDFNKSQQVRKSDSDLNDLQKKTWEFNQKVVNEVKEDCPNKAGGLYWYYKAYILKDKNGNFDISGLCDSRDFCRLLGNYLKIDILGGMFPDG